MIAPFLSAVSFLTRLPAPASVHTDAAALRKAPVWFPAVGLLLGIIYSGLAALMLRRLPPFVVAAVLLSVDALLTGALHLDGLADMADGFGGGRTRDDILRIMRDHSIGAYGGVALILLLLVKGASLTALLNTADGLRAVILIPALSRWSILLLSCCAPYARADEGLSQRGSGAVSQAIGRVQLFWATLSCCAFLAILPLMRAAAAWLSVLIITLIMARLTKRRIGGNTGDVLGANVVLTEAIQMLVILCLWPVR